MTVNIAVQKTPQSRNGQKAATDVLHSLSLSQEKQKERKLYHQFGKQFILLLVQIETER